MCKCLRFLTEDCSLILKFGSDLVNAGSLSRIEAVLVKKESSLEIF